MHLFSRSQLAILVLSVLSASVQAQTSTSTEVKPLPASTRGFDWVANFGFTFGGETIGTANYTDGKSESIRAGELLQFGGGVYWQASQLPIALQATVNYHVSDTSAAKNGSLRFDRVPAEVMAFYTGVDNWRFGSGARFVSSPSYVSNIKNTPKEVIDFDSTVGAVFEVGYAVSPRFWVNVRYVAEKYRPTMYTLGGRAYNLKNFKDVDGNHIGISSSFHF